MRALGEGLRGPGMDTRRWVAFGTVAVIDDDGNANYTDTRAIYIGPEGVDVDVELDPTGEAITAHYAGIMGGKDVCIFSPIRPGDRVLVVMPEGTNGGPPVVVAILNNANDKIAIDPADKKPYFKNDRVLIYSTKTDVDIRTKDGARVEIRQDNTVNVYADHVNLGDKSAKQQVILGNAYKTDESAMFKALQQFCTDVAAAIASDPVILPPPKLKVALAIGALTAAWSPDLNSASAHLSAITKTD